MFSRKRSRASISLSICDAMARSRSVSRSSGETPLEDGPCPPSPTRAWTHSSAAVIDLSVMSMTLMPPTVTARASGLSLRAPHVVHGLADMYRSISLRT